MNVCNIMKSFDNLSSLNNIGDLLVLERLEECRIYTKNSIILSFNDLDSNIF